jgi:hypothetical protein
LAVLRHIFVINKHHLSLKRRVYMRLRTGLVLVCLGWLGFHGLFNTQADQTTASPQVAVATSQTLPANQKLYPDLPKAVANAVTSVVAVQRVTGVADTGITASGVILNTSQVLTAGHTVDDGSGNLACSQAVVQAPGLLSVSAASSNQVTYGALRHTSDVDLAILSVLADSNFRALPKVTLVQNPPHKGDTVYFVNFQPRADGKLRSPTDADNHDPVIFSGTVLGQSPDGLAVATGQGRSYGLGEATNMLRKGASGGAVFDGAGHLVGLSVSTDSLQADRSPAEIYTKYGVSLPSGQYQVAQIQQLDTQTVTSIQSAITPCP